MTSRNQSQLLERLGAEFDRLFGDLFSEMPHWAPRTDTGFPPLNVWEDETHYHAEVEVPGVAPEDLEIEVLGLELTLRGERKPVGGEDSTTHRRERASGRFQRTVQLPAEVDSDKVEATLRNGVLHLALPKVEAAKPHKIQIRTK